jgi:nucleoside-diphosphate-sugar epimerase
MNIFLAGASGAVGLRLIPLLCQAGHRVSGATRSAAKAERLRALGALPAVVDVFDAAALAQVVVQARPEVVIHQLTDLVGIADPALAAEALARNARIRDEGTRNLVAAARAAGARRMVAQSIAWVYAPGPEPHDEADPLNVQEGSKGISVRGVVALESQVLNAAPMQGVVLRYGMFYGPGTGRDAPDGVMPLHVDAAAYAAALAVEKPVSGVFNVAESNPVASTDKVRRELGWRSDFRLPG